MKKDFNYQIPVRKFTMEETKNTLNDKLSNFVKDKVYTKVQIYKNNKRGYEFKILADLENKSIVFKADDVILETKKFNKFSHFEEYLGNKDIEFFRKEYSDKKITERTASLVLNGEINLSVLSVNEQNIYIYFLYKYILYNLYSDEETVNHKMIDLFDDEFVTVENQTADELLKEIRDDVLEQIKKDMNIWLFDNMYYE